MNRAILVELNKILAEFRLAPSPRGMGMKQLNTIVDELRRDLAGYRVKQSLREANAQLAAVLADFSLSPPPLEIKKSPKGVTVSGYASTFGQLDEQGEIVDYGAYTTTIEQHRKAGTSPIMLFSHNMDKPIGVWTALMQDSHGLRVTGTILSSVRKGREAISLLEAKAVNGLSVGFRCKKDARIAGVRHIMAADLWEISLCAFPADKSATLAIVGKEI
jgi:HK97 family phage prohead protease